jgi:hypothetical protein
MVHSQFSLSSAELLSGWLQAPLWRYLLAFGVIVVGLAGETSISRPVVGTMHEPGGSAHRYPGMGMHMYSLSLSFKILVIVDFSLQLDHSSYSKNYCKHVK